LHQGRTIDAGRRRRNRGAHKRLFRADGLWRVVGRFRLPALFARAARTAAPAPTAFKVAATLAIMRAAFAAIAVVGPVRLLLERLLVRRRGVAIFRFDRRLRLRLAFIAELSLVALRVAVIALAAADCRLIAAVEIAVLLLRRIARLDLWTLHGAEDAEIVLCVLKIVFSLDAIAARRSVAREGEIFVVDLLGGAANADVGAVRIERPVRIDALPAALMVVAAAFVEVIVHTRKVFSLFFS
jgi:hypothetical protein